MTQRKKEEKFKKFYLSNPKDKTKRKVFAAKTALALFFKFGMLHHNTEVFCSTFKFSIFSKLNDSILDILKLCFLTVKNASLNLYFWFYFQSLTYHEDMVDNPLVPSASEIESYHLFLKCNCYYQNWGLIVCTPKYARAETGGGIISVL